MKKLILLGAALLAAYAAWRQLSEEEEAPMDDGGVKTVPKPAPAAQAIAELMAEANDLWGSIMPAEASGNALINKARSAIGKGIRYKMGHGRTGPFDALPTNDGLCDCSGFVKWVCSKKMYCTTAWMFDDANGAMTQYKRIPNPVPGCVLVYPGHTAILVNPSDWTIVDCSESQGGISEHKGLYWKTKLANGTAIPCVPV